jgi:WD40 repeat protein
MLIIRGIGPRSVRIAFSPDGRFLAVGDEQGFHVWDATTGGNPLWSLKTSRLGRNFVFTADGKSILGGEGNKIGLSEVRSGAWWRVPFLVAFHPDVFSLDGRFALTIANDRPASVYHVRMAQFTPDGWVDAWRTDWPYDRSIFDVGNTSSLQFSADGGLLVRVFTHPPGPKNVLTGIQFFDSATGELRKEWTGKLPLQAGEGAVSPAGVIVLLRDATFYVINPTTPKARHKKCRNASSKHFTAAAFSLDGSRLATTSNDTSATVWNASTWEVQRRYAWDIGRLRVVCFAPDGLRCAAASDTGQIVVWDLDE